VEDKDIFHKVQRGDVKSFEILFHRYYGMLCLIAEKIIHNQDVAEDIVQEAFSRLWMEREYIRIESSVKAFLAQWIKNRCLNYLKHLEVINRHQQESQVEQSIVHPYEEDDEELIASIYSGIQQLPPQCRKVFKMSRFKGLKHKEIADTLGISVKTVKTHIGKALLLIKQYVEKK
jgi:RNA polymerase sigma-70 factor (ECF subfamily)